jgi:serine/threonine-protein kinase OSR1/STK39
VKAGSGGHGLPRFGGIGGNGGNVFVTAVDDMDLKEVKFNNKKLSAECGENSAHYRMIGNNGNDLTIKAPIGITIISETGRELGQLNKVGDKVLVALGGIGGNQRNNYCGVRGQTNTITLDLKLIADAGLVGFPNAGKSSLLKAISRASPKIANYPFTTINPNIGVMEFDDFRQISVADLPGLIEGAHNNVGLGHKFLKHIVRTKLLVFVIDINGFKYRPDWPKRTPIETFLLLNKELELYDDTLTSKPAVLVVSKIDNKEYEKKYFEFVDELQNITENGNSIADENMRSNRLIRFDEIIGVCSKNAFNIDKLRHCIRDVIDLNFELNKQAVNQSFTFKSLQTNKKRRREEDEVVLI